MKNDRKPLSARIEGRFIMDDDDAIGNRAAAAAAASNRGDDYGRRTVISRCKQSFRLIRWNDNFSCIHTIRRQYIGNVNLRPEFGIKISLVIGKRQYFIVIRWIT